MYLNTNKNKKETKVKKKQETNKPQSDYLLLFYTQKLRRNKKQNFLFKSFRTKKKQLKRKEIPFKRKYQ